MKSVAQGKPYAEQPHARFEKGASERAEPRRCALLHRSNKIRFFVRIFALVLVFLYSVKPSAAFLTSVISTCSSGHQEIPYQPPVKSHGGRKGLLRIFCKGERDRKGYSGRIGFGGRIL